MLKPIFQILLSNTVAEINQAGLLQATVKQYKNRLKTEKLDAAERKNIKNDIKVMEQDIEKIANKLLKKMRTLT